MIGKQDYLPSNKQNIYTAKINIRAQEERERKEKERLARLASTKLPITPNAPIRRRRGLNFHEPGTFVAQAEQLRKKAKLEELQRKIAERGVKTGIADAVKLATLTTKSDELKKLNGTNEAEAEQEDPIPDVEWWDIPILGNRPLEEVVLRLEKTNTNLENVFTGITNLVEHPPIKPPPGLNNNVIAQVPIFLTKKEQKKLRRQNRKNLELEKQEQIKLGLMPKPEPKLKRSNIMYALGNETVVNPSVAEQMVREQEEKRLQAHLEHNASKKLTKEEKRLKRLRKVQEDLSLTGIWVSVYRVLDMSNQTKKVMQRAKELLMSGVMTLCKNNNLVVVEGGPKAQRKFKHMMLDKINWSQGSMTNGKETTSVTTSTATNKCFLVWEGQVTQRSFRGFKERQINNEQEARDYFRQSKVEHYWELALKMSILESIEDT